MWVPTLCLENFSFIVLRRRRYWTLNHCSSNTAILPTWGPTKHHIWENSNSWPYWWRVPVPPQHYKQRIPSAQEWHRPSSHAVLGPTSWTIYNQRAHIHWRSGSRTEISTQRSQRTFSHRPPRGQQHEGKRQETLLLAGYGITTEPSPISMQTMQRDSTIEPQGNPNVSRPARISLPNGCDGSLPYGWSNLPRLHRPIYCVDRSCINGRKHKRKDDNRHTTSIFRQLWSSRRTLEWRGSFHPSWNHGMSPTTYLSLTMLKAMVGRRQL